MRTLIPALLTAIATASAMAQPANAPVRLGVGVQRASGGGLYVASVVAGMPAETVGLERGDVILTVNGGLVRTPTELLDALDSAEAAGGHLTIVIRSGSDGQHYQYDADIATVPVYGSAKGKAPLPPKSVAKNVTKKKVSAPR